MAIRSLVAGIILTAGSAVAAPTSAQQGPTVEGYLCTFAGKCDGIQEPLETRDAPRTKGFRLARPVTAPVASARDGRAAPPAARALRPAAPRQSAYASRNDYTQTSAYAYGTVARQGGRPAGTSSYVAPTRNARADLMIGFELNSARLTPGGLRSAQVFAQSLLMPELRSKRFLIEGHTDLRGSRQLNMNLSQQRAKAVTDYLVSLGVKPDRLETRGFGPDVPLPGHSNRDPTNRRVEAELIN